MKDKTAELFPEADFGWIERQSRPRRPRPVTIDLDRFYDKPVPSNVRRTVAATREDLGIPS